MTIYVIEYEGIKGIVRIAKKNKEEAIKWFKETYPNRRMIDIYEQ